MNTNFGSTIKNKSGSTTKRKNVQVVVRTRPLSEMERNERSKNIVSCDSVSNVVTVKTNTSDKFNSGQRQFGVFDKVYGFESTQLQIYGDVVAPLMKEVLNGYNCTVFAYGQTGSGKTYTMEGHHDESGAYSWDSDPTSGIIPRALHQIFTELNDDDIDFTVRVSYVELYNEQIYDLLSLSEASQCESLRIFDDKNKGVSIVGAEEIIVRSRDEVYDLLRRGAEKRRTAATMMNITSSRSHSVFTVSVMIRESGLVNGEEMLRQGKRESKLTRILQDSLGGKTITTIIATLSPASSNYEESVNTLEYAQRAKNIKNNPEVNQKITRRGLLKEYNEEIDRLRRDLLAAREKHGIYLDKENYDNMVGEIEEKSAKVEDLEGQLAGQLQRVKTLLEDFDIMDANYQSVYKKCMAALKKLGSRRVEVEGLRRDLDHTKDNLNSANAALKVSENSFVRLRAQAYRLQSGCASFYKDLCWMHDRVDSLKQIIGCNDQLLGEFGNGQKMILVDGREQVDRFAQQSIERMEKGRIVSAEIGDVTAKTSGEIVQSIAKIEEEIGNFNSMIDETLATFRKEAEMAQAKLQAFVGSCSERLKCQLSQINQFSDETLGRIRSVADIIEEEKESTSSMKIHLNGTLEEAQSMVDQLVHNSYQRFTATGSTPLPPKNDFNEELVELPPAQELLQSQQQLCTPRRASFYRTRDSILDTSEFLGAVLSPNTLKQNMSSTKIDDAVKLETIGECIERTVTSSCRSKTEK